MIKYTDYKKLEFINLSINKIEGMIDKGHINDALNTISNFVNRIILNPFYVDRILSSQKLDELCLRIGTENLTRLNRALSTPILFEREMPKIIYILSRLGRSGGHSRVVYDFISAQPNKDHLVLITGIGGQSDLKYLANKFECHKNVILMHAPRKNLQSRLSWLQNILINTKSEHVYLFNNHEDSVAASALVPDLGIKGSFYHHGDHHLCLGVHFKDLTHIDPHPMGYHRCRQELNINNTYLPFSIDDKGVYDAGLTDATMLISATAARYNKIEIPYYTSYLEVIPQVLRITGGKHLHIGKLTPWALYSIRRKIKKLGIPLNRFIYIDHVSSVWKALQEHGVNVYIASFPYGAGLTLIEAMGAGIPVILHEHKYSRTLSSIELAYPNAFSWNDPEKLYSYLETLTIATLKSEGNIARDWYERNYQPENLINYVNKTKSEKFVVPPLSNKFKPNIERFGSLQLYKHRLTKISKFIHRVIHKRLSQVFR